MQPGGSIQAHEFCCPLISSLTFTYHPGEQGGSLRQFTTLDKQEHKTRQYKLLKNSKSFKDLTFFLLFCASNSLLERREKCRRDSSEEVTHLHIHACLWSPTSLLYLPLHKAATHLTGLPVALQTAVSTIRSFGVRPLCQMPVFSQSH